MLSDTAGGFRQRPGPTPSARECFAGVVAAIQIPLLVVDAQTRGRSANRAFQDVFGLRSQECVGQSLFALLDGAFDWPALRAAVAGALASSGTFRALEACRPIPGRGPMTLSVSAGAALSCTGAPILVLSFEILSARR